MPAPSVDGRLIYASKLAYAVAVTGPVPAYPPYDTGAGLRGPCRASREVPAASMPPSLAQVTSALYLPFGARCRRPMTTTSRRLKTGCSTWKLHWFRVTCFPGECTMGF